MSNLDKLFSLVPMEEIEQSAQQQIYEVLALPFLKKLAIMPDVHTGYTLPIGGVALLDNVISPEMVGFDIGCGMCLVQTDIDASSWDIKEKKSIFEKIYASIPTGVGGNGVFINYPEFRSGLDDSNFSKAVDAKVHTQLGTLGSGNHFIELGANKDNKIAIIIHSGSRNVGHQICTHYSKNFVSLGDPSLPRGFYRFDSSAGLAYLHDMLYAQDFALDNRRAMMEKILKILGFSSSDILSFFHKMINENHNHAVVTENGILHRKGATPADKGQRGVIPGNMRDGTYVTVGLGNEEYLSSASHGAGRTMSRGQAKKIIDMKDFTSSMEGIVAKVEESTKDESCFAYKDLEVVKSRQEGITVEFIDKIVPLINVKG